MSTPHHPIFKGISAVIFDMDGVISDSQKTHAACEAAVLAEHGVVVPPHEIERRYAGVSQRILFGELFAEHGLPAADVDAAIARKWRMMDGQDEIVAVPGTPEFIRAMAERGLPLAVASGSPMSFINRVVTALHLNERFKALTSSEEVERGKPDPAIFLLAARKLSMAPEKCLVIEDGHNGMIAARTAGMKCVGLRVDGDTAGFPADHFVRDLRELLS